MLLAAALAYVVGVTADCWTTHVALRRGLREGNPIMRRIFGERRVVLGSAVLSAVLLALALAASTVDGQAKTAFWFLVVFGFYRAVLGALNYRRIRRHKESQ